MDQGDFRGEGKYNSKKYLQEKKPKDNLKFGYTGNRSI